MLSPVLSSERVTHQGWVAVVLSTMEPVVAALLAVLVTDASALTPAG